MFDNVFDFESTITRLSNIYGFLRRQMYSAFVILQLGGGYLFGLPVGFIADSIGATVGATVAFILGRTVSLAAGV